MKRRPSPEHQVSHIDPVVDDELIQDESEVGEEIRATITALMPWGISILAHVGLIVIAFFLVWQTIVEKEHQPVVPTLSSAPDVSAFHNQVDEPEKDESSGSTLIQPEITPVTPDQPAVPGFKLPSVLSLQNVTNTGTGIGTLPGDGVGIGGPIGLEIPGSVDNAVFLIDASGSMVDLLPFVINELKRVVNELPADRKATVIFFSGKGVHEVPGGGGVRGLRPMTPAFKSRVREWVALENFNYPTGGRGSAHVEAALTRALSYKPQLVILLSDNLTGGGQGATQHELMQDDLLKLVHDHNKAQPPAKINTIQFLYEDPLVHQGLKGTLDRIADETGGKFRFISQRDLNLR